MLYLEALFMARRLNDVAILRSDVASILTDMARCLNVARHLNDVAKRKRFLCQT